jgi:2-C-methyl-D-erythritol 4-phosphate cytidylyltransferase
MGVTDDAALVEQLGVKVKIIEGDRRNIKITTQEDLALAEAILKGMWRDREEHPT